MYMYKKKEVNSWPSSSAAAAAEAATAVLELSLCEAMLRIKLLALHR
jgi:hypothetical protein